MLHVLTAQLVADERERAIQRRLHEGAVRREATAARAAQSTPKASVRADQTDPADRPCGACPPTRATAG